jgi:hypothetical protein
MKKSLRSQKTIQVTKTTTMIIIILILYHLGNLLRIILKHIHHQLFQHPHNNNHNQHNKNQLKLPQNTAFYEMEDSQDQRKFTKYLIDAG